MTAPSAPSWGPVVDHGTPRPSAVLVHAAARVLLKPAFRLWPLSDRGIRALSFIERSFEALPRSRRVRYTAGTLGGVPIESCARIAPAADEPAGVEVLFLHGGAFLFCGTATHRHLCGRLAHDLGARVHSVNYRQLPEVGVGAAVADAYAAYRALLAQTPEPGRIVVAGDSAGGFLAAKICELAHRDGLAPPAALVGYSPQLSLDLTRLDPALLRTDAYMPLGAIRRATPLWDRGPVPLPGRRTLTEVPPEAFPVTFLTAAGGELLEPDIRTLTSVLDGAGGTVETHVWRRQVHAFPVLGALLPDSREAVRLTVEFLRRNLAVGDGGTEPVLGGHAP